MMTTSDRDILRKSEEDIWNGHGDMYRRLTSTALGFGFWVFNFFNFLGSFVFIRLPLLSTDKVHHTLPLTRRAGREAAEDGARIERNSHGGKLESSRERKA